MRRDCLDSNSFLELIKKLHFNHWLKCSFSISEHFFFYRGRLCRLCSSLERLGILHQLPAVLTVKGHLDRADQIQAGVLLRDAGIGVERGPFRGPQGGERIFIFALQGKAVDALGIGFRLALYVSSRSMMDVVLFWATLTVD